MRGKRSKRHPIPLVARWEPYAIFGVLSPVACLATSYTANSTQDLISDINSVNSGSGGDTIVLGSNITLSSALPAISQNVSVSGGNFTLSGGNAYRLLTVTAGQVSVSNLTLLNGIATGSDGGEGGNSAGNSYKAGGGGGAGFSPQAATGGGGGSATGNTSGAAGTAGIGGGGVGGGTSGGNLASPGYGVFGAGGGGAYAGSYNNTSYPGYSAFGGGTGGYGGRSSKGSSEYGGGGGGGGSVGAGGAIFLQGGSISLSNVTLSGNSAKGGHGGAGGAGTDKANGADGGGGGSAFGGAIFLGSGTTISISGGATPTSGTLTAGGGGAGGVGNGASAGTTGAAGSVAGQDVYLEGGTLNYTATGNVSLKLASTYLASTLNKDGAGILTLAEAPSAANNFVLNVNQGVVTNGVTGAVGHSMVTVASGATFRLSAAESANSINGTGTVDLQGFDLNLLAATSTFGGQVTGTGSLTISGGIYSPTTAGGLPTTAKINLNGGALGLAIGDLSATLGTAAGQLNLQSGSLLASGANRQVTFNGGATLNFGDAGFVGTGYSLGLGSTTANTVTLTNGLSIPSSGSYSLQFVRGSNSTIDAIVAGAVSGAGLLKVTGNGFGRIAALVSVTGGIEQDGTGMLELTAANTYGGSTTINSGAVVFSGSTSRSTGNVVLNGGVVSFPFTPVAVTLGTGAGQVDLQSGGFSTRNIDKDYTINNGAALTWGSGNFGSSTSSMLTLSHASSNAKTTITNAISFGSATPDIYVNDGTAPVDAALSGNLNGTGGFYKDGPGVLQLTGTNNWNGGTIYLSSGTLISPMPTTANLYLTGVLALTADLNATIGSGAGQVNMRGGGFAAYGGDRQVTLNGGATLNSTNAFPYGYSYLGSVAATNTVTLTNPIDTGTSLELSVAKGAAAIDVTLAGGLSGSSLIKDDAGTLALAGPTTVSGTITVKGGELRLVNAQAAPASATLVLNGGILGLASGDLNRSTGTGGASGQVTLQNASGFAAYGADRTVTLNSGSALTYGQNNFSPSPFILGSTNATASVVIANSISFPDTFTIQVENGSSTAGGIFANQIAGPRLVKTGSGTLIVTGDQSSISDTITIQSGELRYGNGGTTGSISGTVIDNGVLSFARTSDFSDFYYISGTGSVQTIASGTVTLTPGAQWTNTGGVFVKNGKLIVNGSISGSTVVAEAGTTVGGIGLVNTNNQPFTLKAGAKFWPGGDDRVTFFVNTGTAELDLSGMVSGVNSKSLVFEMTSSGNNDQVRLTGALDIGAGVLEFDDFDFEAVGALQDGVYPLFSTDRPIVGSLGTNLIGVIQNRTATLAMDSSHENLYLTVVPEPGAAVMFLTGMAIMGVVRPRRFRWAVHG